MLRMHGPLDPSAEHGANDAKGSRLKGWDVFGLFKASHQSQNGQHASRRKHFISEETHQPTACAAYV